MRICSVLNSTERLNESTRVKGLCRSILFIIREHTRTHLHTRARARTHTHTHTHNIINYITNYTIYEIIMMVKKLLVSIRICEMFVQFNGGYFLASCVTENTCPFYGIQPFQFCDVVIIRIFFVSYILKKPVKEFHHTYLDIMK